MPAQERLQQEWVCAIREAVVFSQCELAGIAYHFPVSSVGRNWGAIPGKRNADSINYQRFMWAKMPESGTSHTPQLKLYGVDLQRVTTKNKTHWGVIGA